MRWNKRIRVQFEGEEDDDECEEDEEAASRPAADLIRNSFIISANTLSLPQGSVFEVALRSPGVAAGVQAGC